MQASKISKTLLLKVFPNYTETALPNYNISVTVLILFLFM